MPLWTFHCQVVKIFNKLGEWAMQDKKCVQQGTCVEAVFIYTRTELYFSMQEPEA